MSPRLAPITLLIALGCTSGRSVVGGPLEGAKVSLDAALVSTDGTPVSTDGPLVSLGRAFVDLTATLQATPFPVFPGRVPTPPQLTVGVFADIDGDGRPEILLARMHNPAEPDTNPLAAFRYDRATETLSPLPSPLAGDGSSLVGVLDLDGDGHPDLISQLWHTALHIAWGTSSGFDERSILVQDFRGEGGQSSMYPDDLDADGWLDMLLVHRCSTPECRPALPLIRVAPRRFESRSDLVPVSIPAWPCSAFSAEFVPGERTHITVAGDNPGQPQPTMFYRPGVALPDGHAPFEPMDPIGTFLLSPMGVAAGDVDGDGLFDLVVSINPIVQLFIAQPGWRFRFQDAFGPILSDHGPAMIPWGVALLDIDRDGRPDLVAVHGDDGSSFGKPRAYIGPQYTVVQLNQGGYRFVDVTAGSGLERRGQWRSLYTGDLDLDGAPDLIVGGMGESPRVYHNVLDNGNQGFALRLHGTTSNHLGAGARVRVFVHGDDRPQHHLAGSIGSTLMSPDPLVFVGLGPATTAERVEITWPSGTVQEIRDVAAGGVRDVTEPPVLMVDPPGRHLPADGRSQARIRITPRRPSGTLADATQVEARIFAGGGTLAGAVRDAEGWSVTLTAPDAPGSTVIEVRIDGAPVRIRPRIWWDAR